MKKKLFLIAICVLLVAVVGLTACNNIEENETPAESKIDYRAEFDKLWAEKTATVEETEKQPYADIVLDEISAVYGVDNSDTMKICALELTPVAIDKSLDESADLKAVFEYTIVYGWKGTGKYDYNSYVVHSGIATVENKAYHNMDKPDDLRVYLYETQAKKLSTQW